MIIADLSPYYSPQPQQWTYPRPAQVLPRSLRRALLSPFHPRRGSQGAAMDIGSLLAPNRLGVGLRPYRAGDPAQTLSPRHWLRQEALWVRTDGAPARRRALVLLHLGPSMTFGSPGQPVKGQMAWAVGGLMQLLWERWGRGVHIVPWAHPLEGAFGALSKRLRGAQALVVVSDFLLPQHNLTALEGAIATWVPPQCGVSAVVVRDVEEWSATTTLGDGSSSLVAGSYGTGPGQGGVRGAGPGYVQALKDQERALGQVFFRRTFVSGPVAIEPLVEALSTHGRVRR